MSDTIQGNTCSGQEIMYVKGNKRRIERTVINEFMGKQGTEESVSIDDGITLYCINLMTSTGTSQASPLQNINPSESGHPLYGQVGGQEEILGKQCIIYRMLGQRTFVWQELPLKVEASLSNKTATSIELDTTISDSLFELPLNVVISASP